MTQDPIAGQTYSFSIVVRDSTDASMAKLNPTINAVDDFQISINGGTWGSLDNAPAVSPAASEFIDITFSTAETTAAGAGGNIKLRVADASATDGWDGAPYRFDVVAAALSTLTAAQANAEMDTALSDVGLTTTVTGRIDASINSRATSANIDSALTSYDAATGTELASALADIQADIAALDVIPSAVSSSGNISGTLQIIRASTFSATLTGIIAPNDWVAARLTVKEEGIPTSADSTAVMQFLVSNPGDPETDGLVILNGAVGDKIGGSISINTDDNEVDIALDDDTTAQLGTGTYSYDIKFYYGDSESGPPYTGAMRITATPTQTIIPRA